MFGKIEYSAYPAHEYLRNQARQMNQKVRRFAVLYEQLAPDDWNLATAQYQYRRAQNEDRDCKPEQQPAVCRAIGIDDDNAEPGQVAHYRAADHAHRKYCSDSHS